MPLRLSEHREQDRPGERFWAVGPAALTGQELLAIVLGTGAAGRDALAVAADLLGKSGGSLRRLGRRPMAALARVAGGGRGKGGRPAAALGRGRPAGRGTEPPAARIAAPPGVERLSAPQPRAPSGHGFPVLAL